MLFTTESLRTLRFFKSFLVSDEKAETKNNQAFGKLKKYSKIQGDALYFSTFRPNYLIINWATVSFPNMFFSPRLLCLLHFSDWLAAQSINFSKGVNYLADSD